MKNPFPLHADYKHAPIALVFSDNDLNNEDIHNAIIAVGGRVGAHSNIIGGRERLVNQAAVDTIIIDIKDPPGKHLEDLLEGIREWSDGGDIPTIVSAPLEIIDFLTAHLVQDNVTLLCEPDPIDRISAIAEACAHKETMLHDISTELDSIRIKRISDEVSRLSRNLSRLVAGSLTAMPTETDTNESGQVNAIRLDFHAEPMASAPAPGVSAPDVRGILRLRRLRNNYFSSELFADPAWDMLLDLTAAQLEGEKVAVSSLCIAAAVPPTTALRWIKTMCDAKLFERHADPLDGRRIFIGLSTGASNAMLAYLGVAKRALVG
ncbi:MAG: MarR family winged helix-turn-helix transcriptional regulator [Pseudomonadota bacterium]